MKRAGVTHWRAVLYLPPDSWVVWDRLTGNGVHQLELNWHLGIEPSIHAGIYALSSEGNSIRLAVEGGTNTLHHGKIEPIGGWLSRSYGLKEPITTLRANYTGSLPHEFTTRIYLGSVTASAEPHIRRLSGLRKIVDESYTG